MIYFDNAATSLIKPRSVTKAINKAMKHAGGYGRSGHRPAMLAGELVFSCRELAVKLFGLETPEQVIFTLNATHALNQAIHALCDDKSFAAVSGYEHNSVIRPLVERNISYQVLEHGPFDEEEFLQSAKAALNQGANIFIINHVSNVFGGVIPLEELDKLLVDAGVPLILDASQSAGAVSIDVSKLKSIAAVCMPGHKGLLGPQGTGMLLVCSDHLQRTLMQGGTGSLSNELHQPELLPDRFESGTPNVVGIAGLAAGLQFILEKGVTNIGEHEHALAMLFSKEIKRLPGVQAFCSMEENQQLGVVSFRHESLLCETIAEQLARQDVCVRAGLHCAPTAHRSADTIDTGTIRASFGPFQTSKEVYKFTRILGKLVEKI